MASSSSWLNGIAARFTALRYFALDSTGHASHRAHASMIRRYILWRNNHTTGPRLARSRPKRTSPDAPVVSALGRRAIRRDLLEAFDRCVIDSDHGKLENGLPQISDQALQRLIAWNPAIPMQIVNSFGTGGQEESFPPDLATGPLLACGRAFISLLRGELPACDATRRHPRACRQDNGN
jgi:hypothetical protein